MFLIQVEELKNNRALTHGDILKMSFFIKQTFERYTALVKYGYVTMEDEFSDPNGDSTETRPFNLESDADVDYASCKLSKNLEIMRTFCFDAKNPREYLESTGVTDGAYSGGLDDFLYETLPPCLAFDGLLKSGVMETYYGAEHVHHLLIHFFARLKLEYGSLHIEDAPDLGMSSDNILALGTHDRHFSFRELTLLAGFKTERSVRNLASPSTPEHRRLAVIKEKQRTLVEHHVAKKWLSSQLL